jgi:hypothetical protein
MKGKGVIIVVILVLVLLGVKALAEEFQGFLSFLTLFLSSPPPSGASAPEVGLAAGLGVALFAFLLILLLFLCVTILQFLLSLS